MFSIFKQALAQIRSKGSFAQNFAITLSSNVVGLAIGFAFTPIIARIYSPEAYGIFGLFLAVTQNIGTVATLQLTRGFVIPKGELEFYNLVRLSFLSSIAFTLLSLVGFLVAGDYILALFNAEKLGSWLYLIPAAILLASLNDIWRSWNIRTKEFKRGAFASIASILFTRLFTLGYGLFTGGTPGGLIAGDFLSKPMDSYFLRSKSIKEKSGILFKGYIPERLWRTMRIYKRYPAFVLPGNWLIQFSNQLPVYVLIGSFSATAVGYFAQANSLLSIPMTVLSTAIAPVFLQKAASTYQANPADMPRLVKGLYTRLFYTGVVPFCVLSVFGDEIFSFFLGERWRNAGVFAGYMGIYFIFWLISSPLSSLYRIYRKEHLDLLLNAFNLLLKLAGLWVGVLRKDVYQSIIFYSIATLIGHLLHIWLGFRLAEVNFFRNAGKSILIAALVYSALLLVKHLIVKV